MEKFDLLKILMGHIDSYYQNTENSKDLNSFVTWLTMQLDQSAGTDNVSIGNKYGQSDEKVNRSIGNIDNGIGILNGLMYRYGRMYSKVALEHSSNLSLEEFSFLAALSSYEGRTKTELIHTMIFEKSTGIELIKRLISAGLASEEINPADKRSKLLKITDKGRNVLYGAFAQMEHVSKEITATLDMSEKKALHYILSKLELYHRNHVESNMERLKKQIGSH